MWTETTTSCDPSWPGALVAGLLAGAGSLLFAGVVPVAAADPGPVAPRLGPSSGVDAERDRPAPEGEQTERTTTTTTATPDLPGGTVLGLTLTAGSAVDSGFRVGDQELDDTVHFVAPELLWEQRPSARTSFSLIYAPSLLFFDEHGELDDVENAAGTLLEHAATRRSRLYAGGTWLDTEDPGRHLGGLLLFQRRIPYERRTAFAGWELRFERSSLLLHLGHTSTTLGPGLGLLDAEERENAVVLTYGLALTRATDLTVSASWIDPDVDDPFAAEVGLAETLSEPYETVRLGIGRRFGEHTTARIGGGVLRRDVGPDDDELFTLVTAEILRAAEDVSFLARYDRSLLALGPFPGAGPGTVTGTLPGVSGVRDAVSQLLTLRLRLRLGERTRWETGVWGARTELDAGETLESLAADTRLIVELHRRVGAFLEAEVLDQEGTPLLGETASRTRVALGVIVGISGPRSTWGIHDERPERLRRILPYGRGGF